MLKFKNNNDFILLFEKRLSDYTGAPYVVLTDSCTNAIFLTLKWFMNNYYIPKQCSEIIIPKHTYISVPQTIKNAGYISKQCKIKWKGIYKFGEFPIYDCAVGFSPNMYKRSTFQCLSFQQKKAISIGKGGAILLDNKDAYDTLKRMAWDGRDSSIPVRDDKNIIDGYHMNMTPEMAVRGILLLNQYKFNQSDIKSWKDYK